MLGDWPNALYQLLLVFPGRVSVSSWSGHLHSCWDTPNGQRTVDFAYALDPTAIDVWNSCKYDLASTATGHLYARAADRIFRRTELRAYFSRRHLGIQQWRHLRVATTG